VRIRTALSTLLTAAALLTASPCGAAWAGPTDELSPEAFPGPLHYVALGDSYTSGEGSPLVRDDSPNGWLGATGRDGCHRSAHAYPVRAWGLLDAEDPNWGLSFPACSGATTDSLWNPTKGEDPQMYVLDGLHGGEKADLITIGMGGNDANFADIVKDCIVEAAADRYNPANLDPVLRQLGLGDYDVCKKVWTARLEATLPALRLRISDALDDAHRYLKDGGKIMVIGYPRPFPDEPPRSCSTGAANSVGRDTMRWLDDGVGDRLNAMLAEEAQAAGVSFIDTSRYLAAFGRHDACVDNGAQRWLTRVIPSDLQQSYHPKFGYHEKVAQAVVDCWHTCPPSGPRVSFHV
jgi:hypothetical protein